MSLDFSGASSALQLVLQNHIQGMGESVTQEDIPVLSILSDEATRYGILAAQGSQEAAVNLNHLKAQFDQFVAGKAFRETDRIKQSLFAALQIGGQVLGTFLHAAAKALISPV